MNLDPNAVVQKLYEILRDDSRTREINWVLGRRNLDLLQIGPHGSGAVSLGSGTLGGASIPSGAGAVWDVLVDLRFRSFGDVGVAAIAKAEELRDDGLNTVLTVLWDKRKLDLTPVMFFNVRWDVDSNVEASPAYAEASIAVSVVVRDP